MDAFYLILLFLLINSGYINLNYARVMGFNSKHFNLWERNESAYKKC